MQIIVNLIIANDHLLEHTYPIEGYADVNKAVETLNSFNKSKEEDMSYSLKQIFVEL